MFNHGTSNSSKYAVEDVNTDQIGVNIDLICVDPGNAFTTAFTAGLGAIMGIAVGKGLVIAFNNAVYAINKKMYSTSRYTANEADYREVEPEDTSS